MSETSTPLDCPHCGKPIFRMAKSGDKLRARTSILVLHKSGEVEINCESCRRGVIIPMRVEGSPTMKKAADGPRFVVPLDKGKGSRA